MEKFIERVSNETNLRKLNNELDVLLRMKSEVKYSDEASKKVKIIRKRINELIFPNQEAYLD